MYVVFWPFYYSTCMWSFDLEVQIFFINSSCNGWLAKKSPSKGWLPFFIGQKQNASHHQFLIGTLCRLIIFCYMSHKKMVGFYFIWNTFDSLCTLMVTLGKSHSFQFKEAFNCSITNKNGAIRRGCNQVRCYGKCWPKLILVKQTFDEFFSLCIMQNLLG
jgi:hypothetical protein